MLELSSESINFEPASAQSAIFLDDGNEKMVSVRGNGAMGVTCRGPGPRDVVTFRLADVGPILGLKLSPSLATAAIHRQQSSLDFVNLTGGDSAVYSQSARSKNARILGFQWTGLNELLMITDKGIELYHVIAEKKLLKSLRTHNIAIHWFVYDTSTQLLLVSTGTAGTTLYPFVMRAGGFIRLGKLEVEVGAAASPPRLSLLDRDVTIATVYGKPCVLLLRHNARENSQVVVYELSKDASSEVGGRKAHELELGRSGKFAVQVLDNLVLVHYQSAKLTLVFDIALGGLQSGEAEIQRHEPVMPPLPITLPAAVSTDPEASYDPHLQLCELSLLPLDREWRG